LNCIQVQVESLGNNTQTPSAEIDAGDQIFSFWSGQHNYLIVKTEVEVTNPCRSPHLSRPF
jgi:hypothetical protein